MAGDAVITRFAKLLDVAGATHATTWDEWLTRLSRAPSATWHDGTGGWSAAEFDPPQRAKSNVVRVHGLVLDYDKEAQWDVVRALWAPTTGLLYTTKSHAEGADRLRVVLPLSRSVTVEEYDRLWSWAAARSAVKKCPVDRQCRDASRFWYDPTLPPGGWRAERFTGRDVDPDAIFRKLDEETPTLLVVSRPVTRAPISDEERYRRASAYVAKMPAAVSGSGGHSATFNACAAALVGFDLTESDAERLLATEFNPRCEPPWSERELQHKVASCAKTCTRERGYLLTEREGVVISRTEPQVTPPAPREVSWRSRLLTKPDGTCKRGYNNVAAFVRWHPDYTGRWTLNEMTAMPHLAGAEVTELVVHRIRAHADRVLGYSPGADDVSAAIADAAAEKPFHPVRAYLRSLTWDGVPRLSEAARTHLGSESALHGEMLRRFMVGAVARAIQPGCKLDTALMLVGAQGLRKSTFFAVLGGEWHCDSYIDITDKDGLLQLHSAWLYELSELENVVGGRAESRLKAWLASSHDTFRAPYARVAVKRARSTAVCGTTNRDAFLTDDTGSRRFWIIPVNTEIDSDAVREARDSLWAEAVAAYDAGEPWWLTAEQEVVRQEDNEAFRTEDSWLDSVRQYLTPAVVETTIAEVLERGIGIEPGRVNRSDQMRAAACLRELQWGRYRVGSRVSRRWVYRRDA